MDNGKNICHGIILRKILLVVDEVLFVWTLRFCVDVFGLDLYFFWVGVIVVVVRCCGILDMDKGKNVCYGSILRKILLVVDEVLFVWTLRFCVDVFGLDLYFFG